MKKAKSFWVFAGIVFLLMVSCGNDHNTHAAEKSWTNAENVSLLDSLKLKDLIDQRQGKVLLVNVWATWCVPCREEFPDLVKLYNKYQGAKVRIIGISADYPDEISEKVLPFLREQKVNFPIFVQNFSRQEDFINMMNKDWSGALPATFVYDSTGIQRYFVVGKQSYQDFVGLLNNF
jgi:thiol-disulfide isomerase/thioredoxin